MRNRRTSYYHIHVPFPESDQRTDRAACRTESVGETGRDVGCGLAAPATCESLDTLGQAMRETAELLQLGRRQVGPDRFDRLLAGLAHAAHQAPTALGQRIVAMASVAFGDGDLD